MRIIALNENNRIMEVKSVLVGYTLQNGEIESELGELGQIMQSDGSFVDDTTPIVPQPPQPTLQELAENQLILMDVLATMYEDMLMKGTV